MCSSRSVRHVSAVSVLHFPQRSRKATRRRRAELAQSLAKDLAAGPIDVERAIEKHKAWHAKDDGLAAKIKACEELRTFIEERIEELKTTQPEGGFPAQTSSNRKRRPRSRDKAELMGNQIESLRKGCSARGFPRCRLCRNEWLNERKKWECDKHPYFFKGYCSPDELIKTNP